MANLDQLSPKLVSSKKRTMFCPKLQSSMEQILECHRTSQRKSLLPHLRADRKRGCAAKLVYDKWYIDGELALSKKPINKYKDTISHMGLQFQFHCLFFPVVSFSRQRRGACLCESCNFFILFLVYFGVAVQCALQEIVYSLAIGLSDM